MSTKTWIKRTFALSALAAVAVAAEAPQAQAGTATGNVQVTVNVQAACTVTAAPLAFPAYTLGQAAADQVSAGATELIVCPGATATPVTYGFVAGSGAYAMLDVGGDSLPYELCLDGGNPCVTQYVPTTSAVADSITSGSQSVPLFGLIPAATVVTSGGGTGTGAFAQTVVFTVNF